MFIQLCVAFLALCSLTAASDPDCEDLVTPLEDRSQLAGKWIFYAGTADNNKVLEELRTINSSWIELSITSDSDVMTLSWGDNMNGTCHYGSTKTMMSGNNTKVTFHHCPIAEVHVGRHLATCPDCVLWTDTVTESGIKENINNRNIYLFTKLGTLDAANFEVFKKQVACLNFPQDFHFGDTTDLCPDAPEEKEQ